MTWSLGGIREGGAKELKAEFERHVECFDDFFDLLSVSNVHVLDVVAETRWPPKLKNNRCKAMFGIKTQIFVLSNITTKH